MRYPNSPLRFPGGKSVMSNYLAEVIELNGLLDGTYVEAFAGGAGAAINLLFSEYVNYIMLNDVDEFIYKFWKSILYETEGFNKLVSDTPVNIDEWKRQREIFNCPSSFSDLEIGFSTFFLNRCNRSGILYAGPIGGQDQSGKWKIDARFNKKNLIKRIKKIALYNSRISIFNKDAIEFLKKNVKKKSKVTDRILVYLDPPYYQNGRGLYLNYYEQKDHEKLAKFIKKQMAYKWIISYDDVPEIHSLYKKIEKSVLSLNYCVHTAKLGREIIIPSQDLIVPEISEK